MQGLGLVRPFFLETFMDVSELLDVLTAFGVAAAGPWWFSLRRGGALLVLSARAVGPAEDWVDQLPIPPLTVAISPSL